MLNPRYTLRESEIKRDSDQIREESLFIMKWDIVEDVFLSFGTEKEVFKVKFDVG